MIHVAALVCLAIAAALAARRGLRDVAIVLCIVVVADITWPALPSRPAAAVRFVLPAAATWLVLERLLRLPGAMAIAAWWGVASLALWGGHASLWWDALPRVVHVAAAAVGAAGLIGGRRRHDVASHATAVIAAGDICALAGPLLLERAAPSWDVAHAQALAVALGLLAVLGWNEPADRASLRSGAQPREFDA